MGSRADRQCCSQLSFVVCTEVMQAGRKGRRLSVVSLRNPRTRASKIWCQKERNGAGTTKPYTMLLHGVFPQTSGRYMLAIFTMLPGITVARAETLLEFFRLHIWCLHAACLRSHDMDMLRAHRSQHSCHHSPKAKTLRARPRRTLPLMHRPHTAQQAPRSHLRTVSEQPLASTNKYGRCITNPF